MATKKHVELETAEDFYEKVQKCVGKLDDIKQKMDELTKNSPEPDKEDIVQEALENLEEVYEAEKETAEYNIKIALANYISYYEKEKKTLNKQRDNYEKYVKEEQAKLEALEAEIAALEGDEEQAAVLEDKKADYEILKSSVEKKVKKLEDFNERISNLEVEMEQAKEKFKDYMELAAQEKAEQEKEENAEEVKEVNLNKDKSDESKTEPEEHSEPKNVTPEKEENIEDKSNVEKSNKEKQTAPNIKNNSFEEQDMSSEDFEQPETDEEAFSRIYKLMSKRKTRDSVTNQDIDKMIEILSNKENYSKLNIETRRFLDLPIFPSKAEKIYKQLGKRLSYDVYKITKNSNVLSPEYRAELTKWSNINELGVKIDEKTGAELAIDKALTTANDSDKDQIMEIKERIQNYRNSMVVLDEVMFDRGELRFVNNELPAGNTEKNMENSDVNVKAYDKEEEIKVVDESTPPLPPKDFFSDLGSSVETVPVTPISKAKGSEAQSKTEKKISIAHEEI